MLFLCLFYIWWNLSGYTFSIEFYIAFLKGNIIFFQAVRIVCLPILQGFFRNFIILIFFFHFLPLFKHIADSENSFTTKIDTCGSIFRIFIIYNNRSYIDSILSSNLNKNLIKSCSV